MFQGRRHPIAAMGCLPLLAWVKAAGWVGRHTPAMPSRPPPSPVLPPVLPGDLAVWVFIAAELLVFGVFFAAYGVTRSHHVALFNAQQAELNTLAGAVNTLLLLSGSYGVAQAVGAARREAYGVAARWLLAGLGTGIGFLVIKGGEYADKLAAGITLSTSPFYMFYLSLTFFHFLHVLAGVIVLALLFVQMRGQQGRQARGERPGATHLNTLESGAAYWHMVDLVWIVLFPLVYVLH